MHTFSVTNEEQMQPRSRVGVGLTGLEKYRRANATVEFTVLYLPFCYIAGSTTARFLPVLYHQTGTYSN